MADKELSKILSIETSCDECSVSIVEGSGPKLTVHGLATFSQVKIHAPFGGVVPEVASRNHLEVLPSMIKEAIDQAKSKSGITQNDLDAIAVTQRPGLVGALLVGVSAAKAMAYALHKPLIPVHHLEGHACSIFLEQDLDLKFPALLAIVSGGHTTLHLVTSPPWEWDSEFLKTSCIGKSRDDAAGEAFDKTAKLMGLGYPGGALIDELSKKGNPKRFSLPRALPQKDILDFSFSGLKTAVSLIVKDLKKENEPLRESDVWDLCASTQEAIVDALILKIELAIKKYKCRQVWFVGGVAANTRLRSALGQAVFPLRPYSTDNAAMIGAAAYFRWLQGHYVSGERLLTLNAHASAQF